MRLGNCLKKIYRAVEVTVMINMGTWVVFVKEVTVSVIIVGCSINFGIACGILPPGQLESVETAQSVS
jgi:hypothetical protein